MRILRGEEKSDGWGSLFFITNVEIIGFSLADCESDTWWLLAKRTALYYQDYRDAQSLIKDKIIFYDVVCTYGASKEQIENQKISHELFEGLYVSVVKVHISKGRL